MNAGFQTQKTQKKKTHPTPRLASDILSQVCALQMSATQTVPKLTRGKIVRFKEGFLCVCPFNGKKIHLFCWMLCLIHFNSEWLRSVVFLLWFGEPGLVPSKDKPTHVKTDHICQGITSLSACIHWHGSGYRSDPLPDAQVDLQDVLEKILQYLRNLWQTTQHVSPEHWHGAEDVEWSIPTSTDENISMSEARTCRQ